MTLNTLEREKVKGFRKAPQQPPKLGLRRQTCAFCSKEEQPDLPGRLLARHPKAQGWRKAKKPAKIPSPDKERAGSPFPIILWRGGGGGSRALKNKTCFQTRGRLTFPCTTLRWSLDRGKQFRTSSPPPPTEIRVNFIPNAGEGAAAERVGDTASPL